MTKIRPNITLHVFLIAAFLAVQWSSVHMHLADHHDHDGSHHQHATQAHAHNSVNYHVDNIDSSYKVGEHDLVEHGVAKHEVVELSHYCTSPCCKKLDDHANVSILVAYQPFFFSQFTRAKLPKLNGNKQSYALYSILRLRAPPQFSRTSLV